MTMRELQAVEWAKFFDGFSRQSCVRRMTVEVIESVNDTPRTLADRLPLLGITAEPSHGPARVIAVMLGDATSGDITHMIRDPSRVRVAQISNGQDEMFLI